MNLNDILDSYPEENFLIADGFDEAVIGFDVNTHRLIYSISKCINILINEGMTEEEANEYFYFNVSGSYVSDKTPIWCYDTIN